MKVFKNSKRAKNNEPQPDFPSKLAPIHYDVKIDDLIFDPVSTEVIFYNPGTESIYEPLIAQNIESIEKIFADKGKNFIYLPKFNEQLQGDALKQRIEYEVPSWKGDVLAKSGALTYSDIKKAYGIPDDVQSPCLVRCMTPDTDRELRGWAGRYDPEKMSLGDAALSFSICILESQDKESLLSELRTYARHCYSPGVFYSIKPDKVREAEIEGEPADERFDDDIYLIGKEIRDRVKTLKSKGLSLYAIKRLVGEFYDNPSPLFIDKHNKILLPDYNNKEIKLSPIHKAVFFLFLKHPEGIYFKDLPNYRAELGKIYRSSTGRNDPDAIDESLDKLTDPLDNSINEKCARIKNAFVAEFKEDLAKWYFIDGRKGEKKTIKLPRDLVTWEIQE